MSEWRVCIRRDYYDGLGRIGYLRMLIGELSEVKLYWNRTEVGGYYFGYKGTNHPYVRDLEDYFITIQDWRNQKLESIGI